MLVRPLLWVAPLVVLAACTPSPPDLAVTTWSADAGGRLLFRSVDVFDGADVQRDRDVLVAGDRIEAIAKGGSLPTADDLSIVEGNGRMLLPGLIDAHVHLFSAGERRGPPPPPDAVANAFLYAGVTTILVAAGDPAEQAAVVHAAAGGRPMPNLRYAGPGLTAPGGHPIPLLRAMLPWPIEWIAVSGVPTAASADEAQQVTGATIEAVRPDFFKILYDDLPPGSPHLSREALQSAIDTSREFGVRPIVHASACEDAVDAAEAGAALLMHVPQKSVLTDEQLRRIVATGAPLVTTTRLIAASRELARGGPTALESSALAPELLEAWIEQPAWGLAGFSEEVDARHAELDGYTRENVRRLNAAGAVLLPGTDSGVHGIFPGTSLHRELAALVDLGMSPIQALRAATRGAADVLDPDAGLGRIEPGARADLLLVEGDPTATIADLERIVAVYLGGRELRRNPVATTARAPLEH